MKFKIIVSSIIVFFSHVGITNGCESKLNNLHHLHALFPNSKALPLLLEHLPYLSDYINLNNIKVSLLERPFEQTFRITIFKIYSKSTFSVMFDWHTIRDHFYNFKTSTPDIVTQLFSSMIAKQIYEDFSPYARKGQITFDKKLLKSTMSTLLTTVFNNSNSFFRLPVQHTSHNLGFIFSLQGRNSHQYSPLIVPRLNSPKDIQSQLAHSEILEQPTHAYELGLTLSTNQIYLQTHAHSKLVATKDKKYFISDSSSSGVFLFINFFQKDRVTIEGHSVSIKSFYDDKAFRPFLHGLLCQLCPPEQTEVSFLDSHTNTSIVIQPLDRSVLE